MCTVLLPPGVNPVAVNTYISYHHQTHAQTKHDVLNTHISERIYWVPAWCNNCIRDLEKFWYPACFNIFPVLVCWWNCPCKFNAKAYSFPPLATAPICSYSLHWQRLSWSFRAVRIAFEALFDIMNSLMVHPVLLFSANAETAIPTDVYRCCTLLPSCSGPRPQFVFLRVSHP